MAFTVVCSYRKFCCLCSIHQVKIHSTTLLSRATVLVGYLLGVLTETVTAVYNVCLIMDLTTSKMYFKLSQVKVKAFAQSNLHYSIVTSLSAVSS